MGPDNNMVQGAEFVKIFLPGDTVHYHTRGGVARQLTRIDNEFKALEQGFVSLPFGSVYHRMVILIHSLIYSINIAKKNGWDIDEIREKLPEAWRLHGSSAFGKHIQDWPKGYPGDYEVVDMIMDRKGASRNGTIGSLIGWYALCSPIAQQHREKINIQAELIKDVCRRTRSAGIVSLACGSSRDIERAQKEISGSDGRVVLIDFDKDALKESIFRLSAIKDRVETVHVNIREVPKVLKKLGKFDLIYAGGLFDYLPDKSAKTILKYAANSLNGNGRFMFTNIAAGNPFGNWLDTMGNWKLIERSEEEMKTLLLFAGFKEQELFLDPTGLAWIAKACKDQGMSRTRS